MNTKFHRRSALLVFVLAAFTTGVVHVMASDDSAEVGLTPKILDSLKVLPGSIGALPAQKPTAESEKIRLGRLLFFDARLSRNHNMSCATCHDPEKGFADGLSLAKGFGGKTLGRHTPTVLNAVYNSAQFWDGRAATLAEQATGPIMAAGEMNMPSPEEVESRLSAEREYRELFERVYGAKPTLKAVGDAIAAFEATITTPDSPFDRYARGDKKALTRQQKRGLALFVGKANCSQCHNGINFSDNKYHNLGAMPGSEARAADAGRFAITKDEKDRGAFKTPTVRNVEHTGPFMHDGSLATIEDVIDYYNRGGGTGPKSDLLIVLNLTAAEKSDLAAFLKALSGTIPRPRGEDVPRDTLVAAGGVQK